MSWTITLTPGGDITSLVDIKSIIRTRKLFTALRPNSNKIEFRCLFDSTLYAKLIGETEVEISVDKDSAAYFTGVLSPNYRAEIRDGQKFLSLVAEDYTLQKLGQTIGAPVAWAGYAVCTPLATATSLVHAIATAAGVTLSSGLPTITTVIPYVCALPEDKMTWRQLLDDILFEYGHVFYFTTDGTLQLAVAVNVGDITTTETLTTSSGSANIRGEIKIEKTSEKYDDIRVKYDLVELKTDIVLFQDTSGGDASASCKIPLAAVGDADGKDYYPLSSKIGEVFSAWGGPAGYKIWIAQSAALVVTKESGIVADRALTNYFKKCSFSYKNTAASEKEITNLKITGDAWCISSQNVARSSPTSGMKLFEHNAKYIFNDTDARALANGISQYYLYSDLMYTVRSKTVMELGEYVLVTDAIYAGISAKCRVIGIVDTEAAAGVIEYALEAVDDFEILDMVTEGNQEPIPIPVVQLVDVATAAELALLGITLTLSTYHAERDRALVTTPASLVMTAKDAGGVAYDGRFRVEVSADGDTYTEKFLSTSDESSNVYTIPATIVIEGADEYVVSIRVSLFRVGGTEAALKTALCSVTMVSTTTIMYWGPKTEAPTEGFIVGDYYFDSNVPGSGGGVLRYFSGSAWVEMTSATSGWAAAMAAAINDIMIWMVANPTIIGEYANAANAVFGSVAASQAFITELATKNLKVLGTLRTGLGAETNARVSILDSSGVSGLTFTGAGLDDLSIIEDGAVDGSFTVKITEDFDSLIGTTGPGGGYAFYIDPLTGAALEVVAADLATAGKFSTAKGLSGASGTAIGTGDANTSALLTSFWAQVGSDLNIAGTNTPALAALTETDVAFIDLGNKDLRTYRFTEGTGLWAQVGSDLNIAGTNIPALAALTETDVAFIDLGNDDLRTYRFVENLAGELCAALDSGGETDWYLPSKDELAAMRTALASSSGDRTTYGFSDDLYWSSSEEDTTTAWAQDFTDGTQSTEDKTDVIHVRAIRSFTAHETFAWKEAGIAYSADSEINALMVHELTGYDIKMLFTHAHGHVVDDIWEFVQGAMYGISIKDLGGVEYLRAEDGVVTVGGAVVMPPGIIQLYGGAAAPAGWLLCDGAAKARGTYAGLFGVIGTTYGVGDGASTFNVPDFRESFPAGAGTHSAVTGSTHTAEAQAEARTVGDWKDDQMQQITGTVGSASSVSTEPGGSYRGNTTVGGGAFTPTTMVESGQAGSNNSNYKTVSLGFDSANSPSARAGTTTRPKSIGVNFIIKY
ncbi:MAG: tail fiber protein [Spirochaetes bacterium]|nr:tail fiber protein [Spirochaetota bacterium]